MDADYETQRHKVVFEYCSFQNLSTQREITNMMKHIYKIYISLKQEYEHNDMKKNENYIFLSPIYNLIEEYENCIILIEYRTAKSDLTRNKLELDVPQINMKKFMALNSSLSYSQMKIEKLIFYYNNINYNKSITTERLILKKYQIYEKIRELYDTIKSLKL